VRAGSTHSRIRARCSRGCGRLGPQGSSGLAVPSPRHSYHDYHSGVAEIHTRFAIPQLILLVRSRYLHSGLAAALLGRWPVAIAALGRVEVAGAAAAVAPEVHLVHSIEGPMSEDRAQHGFHLQVFEGEMARLRSFLDSQRVLSGGAEPGQIQMPAPDLLDAFCKTFIFGTHTHAHTRMQHGAEEISTLPAGGHDVAAGLVRSLERTFGLDVCAQLGAFTVENTHKRFRRRLKGDCLHWHKIFKSKGIREHAGSNSADIPVKLEICSGFGEWVIAQAKAEAGVAHWAALELRYDRCHNIFSRMVFEAVSNLAILGGDAAQILPVHILPGSVDHLFCNFPEPPQTNMLQGAESHLHLLTADFFKHIHRVLKTCGRLTILHDEYRYCALLAKTVAALNSGEAAAGGRSLFQSVAGLRGKGKTKYDWEDIDGIRLYHGVPGKKSGHVVRTASYFDQLWETKDRFFLVLSKC
jgi:tRNA G46 methylase TrmB